VSDKGKHPKTDVTTPSKITTQVSGDPRPPFSRDDFFRDLKKAAKKQDRPSQSDR
jgi:hypothetical protein